MKQLRQTCPVDLRTILSPSYIDCHIATATTCTPILGGPGKPVLGGVHSLTLYNCYVRNGVGGAYVLECAGYIYWNSLI